MLESIFYFLILIQTTFSETKCSLGEHWVSPHFRRAYYRMDGTLVSASHVTGHCRKNFKDYEDWIPKLKNGTPSNWRIPNEEPSEWTPEELERIMEALNDTPEILKNFKINGLYRMKKSTLPGNPSSYKNDSIALYDSAFDKDYNLTHVLNHELGHKFYEMLTTRELQTFLKAGKWNKKSDGYESSRPKKQFLRNVDLLSPVEDFADSLTEYFHKPQNLKKVAPQIFNWMEKNIKPKEKK